MTWFRSGPLISHVSSTMLQRSKSSKKSFNLTNPPFRAVSMNSGEIRYLYLRYLR